MLAWLEPMLRATQTSDVQSVFFKEKPNKLRELMDNTGSRVFPTANQSHFFINSVYSVGQKAPRKPGSRVLTNSPMADQGYWLDQGSAALSYISGIIF